MTEIEKRTATQTSIETQDEKNLEVNLSLGSRILQAREDRGMSQAIFSVKAELSQGYLSQLENDEVQNIGIKNAIGIARTLHVGLDFFLGPDALRSNGADFRFGLTDEAGDILELISSQKVSETQVKAVSHLVEALLPSTESKIEYIEKPIDFKAIGETISQLRQEKYISQDELGRISGGLSQGYLSQLETGGVRNPSLSVLYRVSNALDVNIYTLLGMGMKKYPRAIGQIDGFLRSDEYSEEDKRLIMDKFQKILSIVLSTPDEIRSIVEILSIASGDKEDQKQEERVVFKRK